MVYIHEVWAAARDGTSQVTRQHRVYLARVGSAAGAGAAPAAPAPAPAAAAAAAANAAAAAADAPQIIQQIDGHVFVDRCD